MDALPRGAPAGATPTPSRPVPPTRPSGLWLRHRLWQRSLQRSTRRPTPPWAPPPPAPATTTSAAWEAPPPPPTEAVPPPAAPSQSENESQPPATTDPDTRRRDALRELLGGVRDDAALDALDARAPGLAAFEPRALAATLDALGSVLGLERRHLVRVVVLAPRLLTDPGRARRAVAALGEVLAAPRATDVGAYGRAFPPLLALAPDDDGGGGDGDEGDGDGEKGEGGFGDEGAGAQELCGEEGGEEASLRGRVRALACLLLPPEAGYGSNDSDSSSSPAAHAAASSERAFRAWAREYPPRAAALLSQPASEVAAKVARLERTLAPPGGGGGGGGGGGAPTAEAARAARLLALARPLLLDVGEAVLRSRVVALAHAGGMDAPGLASLALSAGGEDRLPSEGAQHAPSSSPPPPPLVPQGVQGFAELLMCAPQRLSEWAEAMSGLLLPPAAGGAAAGGPKSQSALPLAASAASAGGPRAFVVESLLLLGARAPSDVVARWRGLQTAAWRRPQWRREIEERFGPREISICLSCRHDQMARVAFLASVRAREVAGADAVGLVEAVRGSADFDRRFPEFRKWLEKGE